MSVEAFPPAPDVAGTPLDGTKIFTIKAEENAALCASTGVAPAGDGSAHPIYYYIATQVAMGKTVAGLCETCEFDVEDGPMMGSSGIKFSEPLMVGESYKVTGEILSLVRKQSRKLGVMDLTAICLCRDHHMPVRVFAMDKPGALLSIVMGGDEGTLIE